MFFTDCLLPDKADKRPVRGNNQERVVLKKEEFTVSPSGCGRRTVFFATSMLVILVAMGTAWAGEVRIRHVGQGSADEITQCIKANTGLNVLVYDGFLRRFLAIQCRRGEPGPDTVNQIQQHGFRMLTNDRWAFLVPDELLTGVGWPIKVSWTGLNVNVNIEQASTPSGPPPPADLLGSLKEKLVKDARLIPVVGTDESTNDAVAQVDLRYKIYAYKDAAQNTFLVALLHEGAEIESLARVIFIKLAGAGFELLWDSPLFLLNAYATDLEIQDIDGDGHNEIIVRAILEQGAHGGGWQTITIFNDHGEEMTRQPDCKWMRGDLEAGPDRICPIAGESVDLHKNALGTLIEAEQRPAKGGDAVYKLQGGHFVLTRSHRKQLYPSVPR